MSLRYPDLTPAMVGVLRLDAALEPAYGDNRSSKLLAGHAEWLKKTASRDLMARRQAGAR